MSKICELKRTIVKNIISKFGEDYNVIEKESSSPKSYYEISITKYTMCNINITIQIHTYPNDSYHCDVWIADRAGNRKPCTENYLDDISSILTTISNNIKMYLEFVHNLMDELDSREIDYDYLTNTEGEFFLKNVFNDKMIKTYPICRFDTFASFDNYQELEVVPVCGYNYNITLMKIFPGSANISDTVDALIFFLG